VSRRVLILVLCSLALLVSATPVLATSHVIAQKTTKKSSGIYLGHSLVPGHRYSIRVVSSAKRHYFVVGTESYYIVANHSLTSRHASLSFRGTTPGSYTVKPPSAKGVTGWNVAFTVQITAGHGLTVRIMDLGKNK
jgi:hypothetical protein